MRSVKKLALAIITISIAIVASACSGGSIPLTAQDSLAEAFTNRVNANVAIVNNLYNAGLINEITKNAINEKIDNIRKNIISKLNSGVTDDVIDAMEAIGPAIVDWGGVEPTGACDGVDHVGPDCCDEQINRNFITEVDLMENNIPDFARLETSGAIIQPLEIVDSASADTMMETLQYPIYVLNKNVKLDEVTAFLNEYAGEDLVEDEFLQKSGNYFSELKDENGEPVTLLDPDDKSNQIVQHSVSNVSTYVDAENKVTGNFSKSDYTDKIGIESGYSSTNTPGEDMVITQHSRFDVMTIRFREFNTNVYNKIVNTLGLGEEKYLVVSTESGGRIYLLQYPVGYISGFEMNDEKNGYEATIAKSQLEVNLKTQKIYKVSGSDKKLNYTEIGSMTGSGSTTGGNSGVSASKETETNADDAYISLSLGSPDTSSFVVYGETGVDDAPDSGAWNLTFGEKGVRATIPRIVLRDYLEVSYSPGVSAGTSGTETFAVYGRKLRVLNFEASLNTPVAKYCGIDGVVDSTDTELYINDLGDIDALKNSPPYVKYIPNSVAEGISTENDENALKTKLSSDGDYDSSKIENLETIARDKIKCSTSFPSNDIGSRDVSLNDSKPLFYGLVVRKNYLESGLLNWVTSESTTESTAWWNSWLKEHNYTYQIGSDEVLAYLKENYTYALSQQGYIILNLDTLSKLQAEMQNEANLDKTHTLRTFFKILGYSLVSYSFILMMCWVVDTSTDFGINLLEIASFGKLVAISGTEELAGLNTKNSKTSFVNFQNMCMASLKILFIGVLLIFLDIVSIVLLLSQTLGRIGQYIGTLIG